MSAALFAVTIDRARLLDAARAALRLPAGAHVVAVLESGRLGCVDVFIVLTQQPAQVAAPAATTRDAEGV